MAGKYRFERYLATDGPIEELKLSDYSVELWVRPERYAHQSLASFFVSTGFSGAAHCFVLEVAVCRASDLPWQECANQPSLAIRSCRRNETSPQTLITHLEVGITSLWRNGTRTSRCTSMVN